MDRMWKAHPQRDGQGAKPEVVHLRAEDGGWREGIPAEGIDC